MTDELGRLPAWLLLAMAALGCQGSDRVEVSGRITRLDGTPVIGSRVIFRSPQSGDWASGMTDGNGYYELGTTEKGEGIKPGEYNVSVVEDRGDWDSPAPATIHAKYASSRTSGLALNVTEGDDQSYDLELEPPEGGPPR